jgi:hypothetical protein
MYTNMKDVVSIGVQGTWSEEFSINMVKNPHTGSFEVVDWSTLRAYQLTYTMAYMPGLFSSTQLVTIMPRYMIVNCLEEIVMVGQKGAGEEGFLSVGSFKAESWHKARYTLGTVFRLIYRWAVLVTSVAFCYLCGYFS